MTEQIWQTNIIGTTYSIRRKKLSIFAVRIVLLSKDNNKVTLLVMYVKLKEQDFPLVAKWCQEAKGRATDGWVLSQE